MYLKSKTLFSVSVTLLFCVLFSSCTAKKDEKKEKVASKPNIVYIMADDHAYQAISAYNKDLISTPNIDRIANEGVLFENSFVTNSICSPSRAVMLTGKHSHMNKHIDNSLTFDGSQQTFPKLLQKAGYETAIVGKWHLRSDPTGFDYWNILPGQGVYYNPDFIEMGKKGQRDGYVTDVTTDIAFDWLEGRSDKTKPFCLVIHQKAPHRVWMPNTADLGMFDDREFELPNNFFDKYEGRVASQEQHLSIRQTDMDLVYDLKMADHEGDIVTERPSLSNAYRSRLNRMNPEQRAKWDTYYDPIIKDYKERADELKGEELYKWKFQRYMHDYLSCIKSVDDNVGRVLDYLEENGLTENTIIVYTSDQGFYLGEHGWFDKRFMYEQSMRTPFLMKYPKGIKAGGKIKQMIQNIDYAPTFLDYAGVTIPDDMQGESLRALFEDKDPQWRDALYYHYYEFPNEHMVKRHYGVRTERYKLIHFYDDIDCWEMYDLKTDPQEMDNLYGKPEYAELKKSLEKRLLELQVQYKDTDRSTY